MNMHMTKLARRAKPYIWRSLLTAAGLVVVIGAAWAQQTRIDSNGASINGSVIGDDVLYSVGGGRAVSMGGASTLR